MPDFLTIFEHARHFMHAECRGKLIGLRQIKHRPAAGLGHRL